jgi:hypothetical protein
MFNLTHFGHIKLIIMDVPAQGPAAPSACCGRMQTQTAVLPVYVPCPESNSPHSVSLLHQVSSLLSQKKNQVSSLDVCHLAPHRCAPPRVIRVGSTCSPSRPINSGPVVYDHGWSTDVDAQVLGWYRERMLWSSYHAEYLFWPKQTITCLQRRALALTPTMLLSSIVVSSPT